MNIEEWQNIINRNYPVEFDWLAIDKNGHVGVFSSLNQAPIPKGVLQSLEIYLDQKKAIDLLPKMSAAGVLITGGNCNDWINYAKKGLFAYDFQDVHRKEKLNQYDLIARPTNPVTKDHLSSQIVSSLVVLDLEFGENILFRNLIVKKGHSI